MKKEPVKYRRLIKRVFALMGFSLAIIAILAIVSVDFRHQLSQTKEYILYHNEHSKLSELGRTDTLKIEMTDSAFQVISHCRTAAIKKGLLGDENQTEVKAKLFWKGDKMKCKLRLKGDYPDHWSGDKWSFRINVKGENSVSGMDKFSIQDPATRKHMDEWYYQSLLEKEGLINLKYKFIHVEINGEYKGIYAMEESFSKELIEQNRRRNGPILKFEESKWIAQVLKSEKTILTEQEIFETTEIKAFGLKKIKKDSLMNSYFERGRYLLNGLRGGDLKLDEVLDVKKAAMLFAICDLTGSNHGMRWHNQRFYYNPIIDKLEMIGFDSGSGVPIHDTYYNKWKANKLTEKEGLLFWKEKFFSSPPFLAAYFDALKKISSKTYLPEHNADIDTQLKNNLYLMYKENTIYKFKSEIYTDNAAVIRQKLTDFSVNEAKDALAQYDSDELEANPIYTTFNKIIQEQLISVNENIVTIHSNLNLNSTLTIPPNYQVYIEAGVTLNLVDTSAFISYSQVNAIGTKTEPILITSSDHSGSVFITSPTLNSFEYVNISDLNALKAGNLNYSGGINFHETSVQLSHCIISDAHSEDALNLINSYFEISDLNMFNIYSDAVDSDFCTGNMAGLKLTNIGNDGLDFSGSRAYISNVDISKAGDKGISAGEQTILFTSDVHINQCALGLVSKDYSYLKTINLSADSTDVVYLAFKKKREFGAAYVEVLNAKTTNFIEQYLLENQSRIVINEIELTPNVPSVIAEIYGNKYGKSSK